MDTPVTPPGPSEDAGDWVTWFRKVGVPASGIIVLVLCAPGEQHLAELSGWHGWISWGLSGLFTLYAGLAAVISTQLPAKAKGKASSVCGAVFSLALAMAAQPVSHLFVTGFMSVSPRPPIWLVITVSSVPPLILGHLLHFAALGSVPGRQEDVPQTPVTVARVPRPVPVPAVTPKPVSRPALSPSPTVSLSKGQAAGHPAGQSVPVSLSTRVLELWLSGAPEDKIRDMIRAEFNAPKGNTINTALRRARAKHPRP